VCEGYSSDLKISALVDDHRKARFLFDGVQVPERYHPPRVEGSRDFHGGKHPKGESSTGSPSNNDRHILEGGEPSSGYDGSKRRRLNTNFSVSTPFLLFSAFDRNCSYLLKMFEQPPPLPPLVFKHWQNGASAKERAEELLGQSPSVLNIPNETDASVVVPMRGSSPPAPVPLKRMRRPMGPREPSGSRRAVCSSIGTNRGELNVVLLVPAIQVPTRRWRKNHPNYRIPPKRKRALTPRACVPPMRPGVNSLNPLPSVLSTCGSFSLSSWETLPCGVWR
jgi:hypothetical protein